jgi:hypothetical protein
MGTRAAWVFAAGLFVFLAAAASAEPPKWETVYGIATINGRTKKVGDRTYALVGVYFDPLVQILGTNTTDVVWLVNGRPSRDCESPLEAADALPGKDDPRIRLTWMALPDKGDLEVLLGPVHFDRADLPAAEMRKQILDAGIIPYKVGAAHVPSLEAATTKDLAQAMEKQFGKH